MNSCQRGRGLAAQTAPRGLQNHVSIAMGSQGELETELEIAFRQGWPVQEWRHLVTLLSRLGAMLDNLHDALD